jgi:hypothetical protein
MSAYQHTPTGVTIDGILLDPARITRREYVRIIAAIQASDDLQLNDELTGELVAKMVAHWPFDKPVTKDGYLDLNLLESRRVDNALLKLDQELGEKKSDSPSKPPENSNGH